MEIRPSCSTPGAAAAANGAGPHATFQGPGLISWYKRFKMEIDLGDGLAVPALAPGFQWLRWGPALLDAHAEALFLSFRDEIDSIVFPSLGSQSGCVYLMNEIARKPGFTPEATWLLAYDGRCCGTVQGVRDRTGLGGIQNLGVLPSFRGRGLGSALLLRALEGFRRGGFGRAFLEVTARNDGAVRLYRRLGFRRRKTIYKAVQYAPAFQGVL